MWEPSTEIALTLRQFGLMLFLGVVGLAAGPAFIETVFTRVGGLAILMSAVLTALTAALLIAAARLLGQSVDRTYGALAGITGQPAILDYALSRSTDARVDRRVTSIVLMLLFVVGHVAAFLAPDMGSMMAARFVSGLPHGAYFSSTPRMPTARRRRPARC